MHLVDTTMFFSPQSGGVRRYLLAKHEWLERHAPQVRHTLLVPHPQIAHAGIKTCRALGVPLGGGYHFPLSRSGWRAALEAIAPDVIEAGDPYIPAWAARDAAARCGCAAVAFFHSDLPRMLGKRVGRWVEAPAQRYLRTLYGGFDLVLAPSRVMLEKIEGFGIRHAALQPLGVDTTIFRPERRDGEVRRELGLRPDTRLLVFAGRFSREKRIEILQGAVARLGHPYHLLLIGGEKRSRSRYSTVLPYESSPEQLARLVASCDAFVHAGDEETFGLVVVEAMACGLPVVAVARGGTSELVREGTGILAARSTRNDIVQAIEALFALDTRAMGRAARAHAVERYSWGAAFEQLLRHYKQLRGEPLMTRAPLAYGADSAAWPTPQRR